MDGQGPEDTGDDDSPRRTLRMAPDERRKRLVEKAADFFSEEGFDAGTRLLARQLGVTQPLIYRYFESKEALINAVYRKVYLDQWQDSWSETIRDRNRPLRDRLKDFYASYSPAIFNRRWMRIFFFAGLKGLDINTRYLKRVAEHLLHPIAEEMRAHLGIVSDEPITSAEQELVWLMHGVVFYQGIREQIYRSVSSVDYPFAARMAIDMYLTMGPEQVRAAVAAAEQARLTRP